MAQALQQRSASVGPRFLLACLSACILVLAGCASLPAHPDRTPSYASTDTSDTLLASSLAPRLARNPGQSIFYPLGSGPDALAVRMALARAAPLPAHRTRPR